MLIHQLALSRLFPYTADRLSFTQTMKSIIILFSFLSSLHAQGSDQWLPVVDNGFGNTSNLGVTWLEVFNNQLYAVTNRPTAAGPIQIWRSSTGTSGSWTQIPNSNFSPQIPTSTIAVFTMFQSGGRMWLGTQNLGPGGPAIYRTNDGTTWTQINGSGTGYVNGNNILIIGLAIKDNFLYIGTATGTQTANAGSQVWRRPVDESSSWTKVLDFQDGTGLPNGTPIPNTGGMTYLYFWTKTGKLYASNVFKAGLLKGGQLWESSDGVTWTKNSGVGDGFGTPLNLNIASIVDLTSSDGNFLYVTTHNVQNGGQLWRTADGISWTKVVDNGFNNADNDELHNIRVAGNAVWVSTFTESPSSAQVWYSVAGASGTFVQSNRNGFGNPELRGGFPVVVGFGNSVYWGGSHSTTSAQIWRLDLPTVPTASSPTNGASGQPLTPTLSWLASSGATSYRLQVSTSSAFTTTIFDDSTITGTSGQVGPLANSTTYFWRVSAKNASGTSPFSSARSFTTIVAAPTAPTLASPPDGATGVSTSPTLSWNASTGATTYRLQLATVSTFESTVFDDSTLTSTSKQVGPLANNTTYFWRVSAKNAGGTSPFSASRRFTTAAPSSVERVGSEVPAAFALSQNYPNPFNPVTTIEFSLPQPCYATLMVFNTLGIQVQTLVDQNFPPGTYPVLWNAVNAPSGAYFYRLQARPTDGGQTGSFVETKRLILLK